MRSRWLNGVVAAAVTWPLGAPAAFAYGPASHLGPPAAQQTALPFALSKQFLQETFLPKHEFSRRVFEQTGILLVTPQMLAQGPGVPLVLEQYLTQVAAHAGTRITTLQEAAQAAGIKLVWYDPEARTEAEARQSLETASRNLHRFSETEFSKEERPDDDVLKLDPAWFTQVVHGAPAEVALQLRGVPPVAGAAPDEATSSSVSAYDRLTPADRLLIDGIHPSPEARRVLARVYLGELSEAEGTAELVRLGTVRELAEAYVQLAARPTAMADSARGLQALPGTPLEPFQQLDQAAQQAEVEVLAGDLYDRLQALFQEHGRTRETWQQFSNEHWLEAFVLMQKLALAYDGMVPIDNPAMFGLLYTPRVGQVAKMIVPSIEAAHDLDDEALQRGIEERRRQYVMDDVRFNHDVEPKALITSNGSATLGLGNLGPYGIWPILVGKILSMYAFGGFRTDKHVIDDRARFNAYQRASTAEERQRAFEEIVQHDAGSILEAHRAYVPYLPVKLEDFTAGGDLPLGFRLEDALIQQGIFAMQDDQHGTAQVYAAGVLDGLRNAFQSDKSDGSKWRDRLQVALDERARAEGLSSRTMLSQSARDEVEAAVFTDYLASRKVVVEGAGASAITVVEALVAAGVAVGEEGNVVAYDSQGAIHSTRESLSPEKRFLAGLNRHNRRGSVPESLEGAHVYIGLSTKRAGTRQAPGEAGTQHEWYGQALPLLSRMAYNAVVIAGANPDPEFDPFEYLRLKAEGQLGNILDFGVGRFGVPGVFTYNNSAGYSGLYGGAYDALKAIYDHRVLVHRGAGASDAGAAELAAEDLKAFIRATFTREKRSELDVYAAEGLSQAWRETAKRNFVVSDEQSGDRTDHTEYNYLQTAYVAAHVHDFVLREAEAFQDGFVPPRQTLDRVRAGYKNKSLELRNQHRVFKRALPQPVRHFLYELGWHALPYADPLDTLPLSLHAKSALMDAGLVTVDLVASQTRAQLLGIKGIGPARLREIARALLTRGVLLQELAGGADTVEERLIGGRMTVETALYDHGFEHIDVVHGRAKPALGFVAVVQREGEEGFTPVALDAVLNVGDVLGLMKGVAGGAPTDEPMVPLAERQVVWFDELGQHDTAIAGGKGANLGEMVQHRVRVPQGFVITAAAFQETLATNEAHERLERLLSGIDVGDAKALGDTAAEIQRLIKSLTLPPEVVEEILDYHQALADRLGLPADEIRVAVRSSATAEDREVTEEMKKALGEELTSGSSAGQQSTFLNVRRSEIVERVLDDYASLFNSNAISYRDNQGMIDFLLGLDRETRAELERRLLRDAQTREVGELLRAKRHTSRLRLRRAVAAVMPELLERFDAAYDPYVNPRTLSLAVVVQHMIRSDRAFTVFSYDNRSGWTGLSLEDRNVAAPGEGRVFRVDANYGLGESVVQGLVVPDSYLVHVFTDTQGTTHANLIEKTLGNKKLRVIYVEDALDEIGLTEDEAMQLVELVKATEAQSEASRLRGGPEVPQAVLGKLHLTRRDADALVTGLLSAAELDYDALEDAEIPQPLRRIALSRAQFFLLAHLVKARLEDPNINTVETSVPAAWRDQFALSDEQVRHVALAAKEATDSYGNVRDMEGAWEGRVMGFVQSRGITTPTEVDQPFTLQLRKTVIPEAAAQQAEQEGRLAAIGVPGRNAVVGEIFVLDRERTDLSYDEQLKNAQDRAVELAREGTGHMLLLRTKFTTPQDVPAMEVSGGVIADEGGDTSHAAIVSRELKIATVVGISEYLQRLRRDDPDRHAEILPALNANGSVVTVDANSGKVYLGELPVEIQEVDIPVRRDPSVPAPQPHLPVLRFTHPGLIVANPAAMREISKLSLYDSYYGISLARAEFMLVEIGVHPRAIEAYDNLRALEADPGAALSERERRDVEILQGNPKLVADIAEKIRGYPSAKEFFIDRMYQGISSMAAANGLDKKVLYRFNDFKQNELNKIAGGPEFGLVEEASMIGDRGSGWLLKDDNRTALGMEMEALRRAYEDGYTNVGAFFAFVRTPDELRRGLERFEEAEMPLDTVGMMVELPSNVIQAREFADLLAEYSKRNGANVFFSFGTNDLTQLTRVAGREEPQVRELFSEAHPAIVGSLRHVVQEVARARERHGLDRKQFTCGLCGQAIVKLVDSDPSAARSIAVMLDSTGLDILAFMKTVRLIADAELDLGMIADDAKATAEPIARGESSQDHGAAARDVLVARSFEDLPQVSVGDFLVVEAPVDVHADEADWMLAAGRPSLGVDPVDPPAIEDAKAVEQLLDRIQRESLSSPLQAVAGRLKEQIPADEDGQQALFQSPAFRESVASLTLLDAMDRAGAVLVPEELEGAAVIEELARGLRKPLLRLREGREALATGSLVTIDFAAGAVYEGELALAQRTPPEADIVQVVEQAEEPVHVAATFASARDVYQQLGVHPLAFVRRKAGTLDPELARLLDAPNHRYQQLVREADGEQDPEALFKRAVRLAILAAGSRAHRTGSRLIYRTSDLNSADFRALALGDALDVHEENPPLGLGGFYRFVKDEEYRTLLRWELEVVAQLRRDDATVDVELADVRDLEHLDTALTLLRELGLEPATDGLRLGLRMDNPDNYLFAREYMERGRLNFVSVDERWLSQTYLAADRSNAEVPVDDAVAATNLVLPVNIMKQAAYDLGVRWTVPSAAEAPQPAPEVGQLGAAGPVVFIGSQEDVSALREAFDGGAGGEVITAVLNGDEGPKSAAALIVAALEYAGLDGGAAAGAAPRRQFPVGLAKELGVRETELATLVSEPVAVEVEANVHELIEAYRRALPSG